MDNIFPQLYNSPTVIRKLIYKYSFNVCKTCNNRNITPKELIKFINNKPNFKCIHCSIEHNLRNYKCKEILGIR